MAGIAVDGIKRDAERLGGASTTNPEAATQQQQQQELWKQNTKIKRLVTPHSHSLPFSVILHFSRCAFIVADGDDQYGRVVPRGPERNNNKAKVS